jgi:hypothetical protein
VSGRTTDAARKARVWRSAGRIGDGEAGRITAQVVQVCGGVVAFTIKKTERKRVNKTSSREISARIGHAAHIRVTRDHQASVPHVSVELGRG